jgi:hypothetical protein
MSDVMLRSVATLLAILVCALFPAALQSQISTHAESQPTTNSDANSNSLNENHLTVPAHPVVSPRTEPGSIDDVGSHPATRITYVNPAPPGPAPWPLHERVAWASNLMLAVAGYLGIVIGLRMMARIDRQARTIASLAESVAQASNAVLLQVQGTLSHERPWLLAAVEPSLEAEDSFNVVISNRGQSPAEIICLNDRIAIVMGEKYLPKSPEYSEDSLKETISPLILVPGEFTVVQRFAGSDLQWICKTQESRRRVEQSEDQIFLHGRVSYRNLISPPDDQPYVTDWCCKYMQGNGKMKLAIAGPREYNKHR